MKPFITRIAIFVAIIIIFAMIASFSGFTVINTGEVGMRVRFGKIISEQVMDEGLYFYNPMTTKIVKYDIKHKTSAFTVDLYTKDNQPATFAMAITYHLVKDDIVKLHTQVGIKYEDVLFLTNINSSAKNIAGKFETDKIIENRELITEEIKQDISKILSDYGICVDIVNITNIDYSDEYERAISEKQIALQQSQKAKNETARVEEEAKQVVLKVKADSEGKEILAEAEARAMLTKVKTELEAKKMQNEIDAERIRMIANAEAEAARQKADAEAYSIAKTKEAEANGVALIRKQIEGSKDIVSYIIANGWDGKLNNTYVGNSNPLMMLDLAK